MGVGSPPQGRTAFVAAAYSEEFLSEIGEKFHFDARDPKFAGEIRGIGRRYFADIANFNDDGSRDERRAGYKALKKQIGKFSELLARPEYADIASDLHFAAWRLGEPPPQTEFPQLSKFEKTRGAPYLAEFQRLLNLLDDAAADGIKCFSPQRGRRRNYPVENFARRAAYIWADMLGRPYKLDYHAGAVITPAGDFVCTLLKRLDPEIPEKAIITAMRLIVAEQQELSRARKPKT